jgi:MFS family permease
MNTSSTPTNGVLVKLSGLLINRQFALIWSGQAISVIGDILFDTTLVLWVATGIARGQPWAPLAVSGILLTAAIPRFIIGPVAGVFTDRWDKRSTMLAMDAIRAVLIVLLVLLDGILPPALRGVDPTSAFLRLGIIYAIVFLTSSCTQFFTPSLLALMNDIVEGPSLVRASGLIQIVASLAIIIGPALAGLLFSTVGVQWAFLLNAFSFMASFSAILAVRAPRPVRDSTAEQHRKVLHEFLEGMRFYVGNRLLVTILISGVLITLGSGAINALNVFFVIQNLHASASLYGLLSAVLGLGAIVGAAASGLMVQRLGMERAFWLSIILSGVVTLLYARLANFPLASGVIFLLGGLISIVNVVVVPLVLGVTPNEFIGRVSSVITPAFSLAAILSLSVAGYLASTLLYRFHATWFGVTFGPIDTIFLGTGVLMLIGGLYAMMNLKNVELAKEKVRKEG